MKKGLYLADNVHRGMQTRRIGSFFAVDDPGTELASVKKCEDDDTFVCRLLETQGKDKVCTLTAEDSVYPVYIGHHEILTLKADRSEATVKKRELLEREETLA